MADRYDETLLLAYVEEELTDDQLITVEQWMADDPRLRDLLDAMQQDRAVLRSVPEPAAPNWVMDEIDADLERSMLLDDAPLENAAAASQQRQVVGRIGMAVAVAAMVLVATGVVIWSIIGIEQNNVGFQPVADNTPAKQPADPPTAAGNDTTDPNTQITDPPANSNTTIAKGTGDPDDGSADPNNTTIAKNPGNTQTDPPANQSDQIIWQVTGVQQEAGEQRIVIRLKTRNVEDSVEELNRVAGTIAQARLRPTVKPVIDQHDPAHVLGQPGMYQTPVAADAQPVKYELQVPQDQVHQVVALLREPPRQGLHDVAIEANPAAPGGVATSVATVPAPTGQDLRQNWPKFAPDYGSILRQQVPLQITRIEPTPDQTPVPTVHAVVIPIVIEKAFEDAPGANEPAPIPDQLAPLITPPPLRY